MNLFRSLFGRRGERVAARYLRNRRYRLLARNYQCEVGEIDLICADGDTIVFVEVKTRASDEAINPAEAIHPAQWSAIERSARKFLNRNNIAHYPCRFDVVTVRWPAYYRRPVVTHFVDVNRADAVS